jgi:NAD(P)H-hydrate epimerase
MNNEHGSDVSKTQKAQHKMKTISLVALPQLTTAQMKAVDRLMIEEWQIGLIQMMENAGRNTAELARRLSGGTLAGQRVMVLCGKGNNGGGGMVAARHLNNWGAEVQVKLIGSPRALKGIPARQWQILRKMGLISEQVQLESGDLIIDAMIGYGLEGLPRPPVADWIEKANASRTPILALDAPTGLDATRGASFDLCIRAQATLTLALPKTGLVLPEVKKWVGELYLADIGVPPELYAAPSLGGLSLVAPFAEDTLVRVLV